MLWRPTTCSSWIIITSWCHLLLLCCCGIYAFCQFTRWLPRLCSPMLASQGPASVWSCGLYAMRLNSCTCLFTDSPKGAVRSLHHSAPQGLPPCSTRVMDSRCVHSASPITVSARTCQQWQVPSWSWILRTRRVESRKATYELHGVAANG